VKTPESDWIKHDYPELRIVDEELWLAVQRFDDAAAENSRRSIAESAGREHSAPPRGARTPPRFSALAMRSIPVSFARISKIRRTTRASDGLTANFFLDKGRLKSRPTVSPRLLSRFLRCSCGSTMYARMKKNSRPVYVCIRRAHRGVSECGLKPLPVEWADKMFYRHFEGVLVSRIVIDALDEYLAEVREGQEDPKKIEAEAKRPRAEIQRLIRHAADGEIDEIGQAVKERKAKLAELEGQLACVGGVKEFEMREFAERVGPVLRDWQEHLRRNTTTAQQVLHKFLPNRITVSPNGRGGWKFSGPVDYSRIAEDVGIDAIVRAVKAYGSRESKRAVGAYGSRASNSGWRTCWRTSGTPR